MRVSAAGITLLGLGLLAATGCQSAGGGGYASSNRSWHWPWSKKAAAETDIAQNAPANQYPQLPSQMAQNQQPGGYSPNYYGAGNGAESYAQNPPTYPPQTGYGSQVGYGAQASYGATAPANGAPTSQGLYDAQTPPTGGVAQTGGYPMNQAGGYQATNPATGYADPATSGVSSDYYNPAYARQDAAGYPAGATPAAGYAPVDPAQPQMGYEAQAGGAMPANPAMPTVGHPEAHVADARGGMPAASAPPQTMADPNQMPPGSAYGPVSPAAPNAWADPAPASTSAGNFNEPQGFQPGSTGYTPASNGFQPAGAAPYQSPAGPYNTNPNNPSAPRYRPGSTTDYYQQGSSPAAAGGSNVAAAAYHAVPNAAPAEVPAVYSQPASEMSTMPAH